MTSKLAILALLAVVHSSTGQSTYQTTVTGVTGWGSDESGRYFTCDLDDFKKAVGPVDDDDGTVYNVRHKPV